jgi:hypothetical protein
MTSMLSRLGLMLGALLLAAPATAALIDHGSAGEYFHDASTGLYWYDPAHFVGYTRAEMDAFVAASPIWMWATSDQIDALAGQATAGGEDLEQVLGARQYTLAAGGPRWLGYYASPGPPDGWIVQANELPHVVSGTGFQNDVASVPDIVGVGGWMVSRVDPVPEPHVLSLMAAGAFVAAARLRRRTSRVP